MRHVTKDPNSRLDYVVNWKAFLVDDTIDTVEWILEDDSTLSIASESNDDTEAVVWLEGGEAGATETITCRMTSEAGRIEDYSFQVVVADK